jgi:hypothetical protein
MAEFNFEFLQYPEQTEAFRLFTGFNPETGETEAVKPGTEIIFTGAEQSGKSLCAAQGAAWYMLQHPDWNGLILVPVYAKFDDGIRPHLERLYPWNEPGFGRWSQVDHVYKLPKGGRVYVETAEEHLTSLSAAWGIFDEPGDMPGKRYDDWLSRRSAWVKVSGAPLFLSGTPRTDFDWYKGLRDRAWKERNNPDRKIHFFQVDAYKNPMQDREDIEVRKSRLSDTEIARRIYGEFVSSEGLVYAGFDVDDDTEDPPKLGRNMCDMPAEERLNKGQVWVGVDPGFHVFAAVWLLVEEDEGGMQYTQLAEYRGEGLTDDENLDAIHGHELSSRVAGLVYDAADPNVGMKIRKAFHRDEEYIPCVPVGKGKRDGQDFIPWSIGDVRKHINTGRYKLVRGACTETLGEFALYRYPEQKEGRRAEDLPIKANDHLCDAGRYVVVKTQRKSGVTLELRADLRREGESHPLFKEPKRSYGGVPLIEAK